MSIRLEVSGDRFTETVRVTVRADRDVTYVLEPVGRVEPLPLDECGFGWLFDLGDVLAKRSARDPAFKALLGHEREAVERAKAMHRVKSDGGREYICSTDESCSVPRVYLDDGLRYTLRRESSDPDGWDAELGTVSWNDFRSLLRTVYDPEEAERVRELDRLHRLWFTVAPKGTRGIEDFSASRRKLSERLDYKRMMIKLDEELEALYLREEMERRLAEENEDEKKGKADGGSPPAE